jgi:hypothetical protein
MKRIMLSAAALMFIISGAFAGTKKSGYTSPASSVQLNRLSQKFEGLVETVPSEVEVKKNLHVYKKDENNDDQTTDVYMVSLVGKHFDESAIYDKNGMLVRYKDIIKDAKLPAAVEDAINKKHADAEITRDREIIKKSKDITKDEYKVHFKDGHKHYAALIEFNGTVNRIHRRFI